MRNSGHHVSDRTGGEKVCGVAKLRHFAHLAAVPNQHIAPVLLMKSRTVSA